MNALTNLGQQKLELLIRATKHYKQEIDKALNSSSEETELTRIFTQDAIDLDKLNRQLEDARKIAELKEESER